MEQSPDSDSIQPSSGSIDKTRVLDIRPLRYLVPVFPSPDGMSSVASPQPSPFVCVPPTGPFPPGVAPFYPFLAPNGSQRPPEQGQETPPVASYGFTHPIPSPVPLNSFKTPQYSGAANGDARRSVRGSRSRTAVEDDGSNSQNQSDQYASRFDVHGNEVDDTDTGGKRKGSLRKGKKIHQSDGLSDSSVNFDAISDEILRSFNLINLDTARRNDGDRELVGRILLAFDVFRRRLSQFEEPKDAAPGAARRPDLRASNILMSKGARTNNTKRIGRVPGVEVGDIFFFRMELCLVGLHAPSMAGIDYMSVKMTVDEEPVAVSIVSSGGYDDEGDKGDVLIYSGQGGVQRRDGLMFDQKLERGNLALEKSLHRANEVRVIRGLKDAATTGKIYVYDGLYKVQESWTEKNKSGCNVFKYKLFRIPGQPEAFTLWKSIQQWKDGLTSRVGVILPDLTSGAENLPVSLVNDVDNEKGPAYFTYIPTLKHLKPFMQSKPSVICQCLGGCQPGDTRCPCIQKNGGFLPYSPLAVISSYKSTVYECGPMCPCPPNCRNRMSQAGLKVRLEVFRTKDRGWGLRSWDPIRSGGFICEYAGEAIDASRVNELNEDSYVFDATRTYEPLDAVNNGHNEPEKIPFPLVISAKDGGNVARFMNHSCSPNVFWLPVVRPINNEAYYHIAFFAIRHIPPMQELTYDYGALPSGKPQRRKKKCLCGSSNCKGYFY